MQLHDRQNATVLGGPLFFDEAAVRKKHADTSAASRSRYAPQSLLAYRHDGGHYLVELNLRDIRQLFNSLDPAPFREKDLDYDAEEYIVSAIRELGLRQRSRMVIHLPANGFSGESSDSIVKAIRHYFEYRAHHAADDLKQMLGRGALSFFIGLLFLFACLWLRQFVVHIASASTQQIFSEGLLIMGWVAMWRPIEVFLYDWWPLLHRRRIFRYIEAMPIEVNPAPAQQSN